MGIVWGIGGKPLSSAEIASVTYSRYPVTGLVHVLRRVDAPLGMYYFLLHGWLHITTSIAGIRLLSALFAVAAVVACMGLARRLFGLPVALVAGGLLAVNVFFIRYGRDARPYSLVLMLSVLATWTYVDAVERKRRADFIRYGAVATLAVYAHMFAVLILLAHACAVLLLPDVRRSRRRWLTTYAAIAFLTVPVLAYSAMHQTAAVRHLGQPGVVALLRFARDLSGNQTMALVAAALLSIGLVFAWTRRRVVHEPATAWRVQMLALMLVAPPLALFSLSRLTPAFAPRYLIEGLFPFTALLALVLTRMRPRMLAAAGTAAVVVLSSLAVARYDGATYQQGTLPQAVATMMHDSRPGDAIGFAPRVTRRSFDYYLARYRGPGQAPADVALSPDQPRYPAFPRELPVSAVVDRLRLYQRLWVIGPPDTSGTKASRAVMYVLERTYLDRSFRSRRIGTFGAMTLLLYTRSGT